MFCINLQSQKQPVFWNEMIRFVWWQETQTFSWIYLISILILALGALKIMSSKRRLNVTWWRLIHHRCLLFLWSIVKSLSHLMRCDLNGNTFFTANNKRQASKVKWNTMRWWNLFDDLRFAHFEAFGSVKKRPFGSPVDLAPFLTSLIAGLARHMAMQQHAVSENSVSFIYD